MSVRYFDFDPKTTLGTAIRTIVAALDDEDLRLNDSDNATTSRITSVLIDGKKRVIVPTSRISPKGDIR
jgi:hypothetical protein